MGRIKFLINGHSQRGINRRINQDCIGVRNWRNDQTLSDQIAIKIEANDLPELFLLADGIGGHVAGEVASRTAVDTIFQNFDTSEDFNIRSATFEAHTKLSLADTNSLRPMGTTIVGLILDQQNAEFFNLGDSRAYKFSKMNLIQITKDDVSNSNRRNVVNQCLGGGISLPTPNTFYCEYKKGDTFLLISDGISGFLSKDEIYKIMQSGDPKLSSRLCAEAVKSGSSDDISAIVIECR